MALLQLSGSHIGESPRRNERYTAPPEMYSRLTRYLKYVQTDLEAGRQSPPPWAELIICGSLVSMESYHWP
jgi:hypothetical protein